MHGLAADRPPGTVRGPSLQRARIPSHDLPRRVAKDEPIVPLLGLSRLGCKAAHGADCVTIAGDAVHARRDARRAWFRDTPRPSPWTYDVATRWRRSAARIRPGPAFRPDRSPAHRLPSVGDSVEHALRCLRSSVPLARKACITRPYPRIPPHCRRRRPARRAGGRTAPRSSDRGRRSPRAMRQDC